MTRKILCLLVALVLVSLTAPVVHAQDTIQPPAAEGCAEFSAQPNSETLMVNKPYTFTVTWTPFPGKVCDATFTTAVSIELRIETATLSIPKSQCGFNEDHSQLSCNFLSWQEETFTVAIMPQRPTKAGEHAYVAVRGDNTTGDWVQSYVVVGEDNSNVFLPHIKSAR